MKLHLLDRSSLIDGPFATKNNRYPYFLKIWHYHPELELILVVESSGTSFIGDSVEKFTVGEIILIGRNLPHMMLNDDEYFEESSNLMAEAQVIHFKEEFLGIHFFNTPGMQHISELFKRAENGIKFLDVDGEIVNDFNNIFALEGFEKTIGFIRLLNDLAKHDNYKMLSSIGFINAFNNKENNKLDKIYEFIFKNFNKPISLNGVAEIACMNPSAFSRFFKRVNRKPFSRYLNEVRIGYACKLLLENKFNITTVCYESGFNNISNFNRQFRAIRHLSPTEYLLQYSKIEKKSDNH